MTEQNKEVVRRIFEEGWNRAAFEGLENAVADEALFHFRGQTLTTDLEDLKRLVALWREAFPDLRLDVEDMVAEGDRVAVRLTMTGTQRGPWKGFEASGKSMTVSEMMFFRFADGQIVELWEDYDELGMWQQLGRTSG